MQTPSTSRILELTKALCAIPSVSGRAGEEIRCADFIFDVLKDIAKKEPGRMLVRKVRCKGDPLNREAVFGLLKAKEKTEKTVVLTGHFDVVSTQNCGALSETAFDTDAYTEALNSVELPPCAKMDYDSGNWLFGRGSMDMKAGLALFLASMECWVEAPDLKINILFWAVPDEEADSKGMIGSLEDFVELCKEEKLHVIAALTGEPCFWTSGSSDTPAVRPYYTGSTGKLMPFFYAFGKSAHVGNYLLGFNAALLISEAVGSAEADTKLYEGTGLDLLAPPVCLDLRVCRDSYSVTVPEEAYAFFNVLTAIKSPQDVLKWAQMTAAKAANKTRLKLTETLRYSREKGGDFPEIDEVSVMTFSLVRKAAQKELGDKFDSEHENFYRSLPEGSDAREIALKECAWLFKKAHLPRPAVVVGFLPPYYPAVVNGRKTEEEIKLRSVMEKMVQKAAELSDDGAVCLHEVFGGISDLSFLSFKAMEEGIKSVKENMAGWGKVFSLPEGLPGDVRIPVANMGPAGKDAHQATERLELNYSLNVAPKLLTQTIEELSH